MYRMVSNQRHIARVYTAHAWTWVSKPVHQHEAHLELVLQTGGPSALAVDVLAKPLHRDTGVLVLSEQALAGLAVDERGAGVHWQPCKFPRHVEG